MTRVSRDFEPDWTGLNPENPRDRALAYRQAWSEQDIEDVGPLDELNVGDRVWRVDEFNLRIEEGYVAAIEQADYRGSSISPEPSDRGGYLLFTARFNHKDYVCQTYQWKFFDSVEKAHERLKEVSREHVQRLYANAFDAERKMKQIHAGEFEVRSFTEPKHETWKVKEDA